MKLEDINKVFDAALGSLISDVPEARYRQLNAQYKLSDLSKTAFPELVRRLMAIASVFTPDKLGELKRNAILTGHDFIRMIHDIHSELEPT